MLHNKKASHEAFLFSVTGRPNLGLPLPVEIPNSHDEVLTKFVSRQHLEKCDIFISGPM